MNVKILTCSLLLGLGSHAVLAKEAPPPPDPEMLEFLGTFETSGGKEIDPFLLESEIKTAKQAGKPASKGERTKRKSGEKEKDGKHE